MCKLHWPSGVSMRKRHRWLVPEVPPSVFSLPSTYCRPTISHSRDVGNRRVSSEARAQSCVAPQPKKTDKDRIVNWEQFKTHCHTLGYPISVSLDGLIIMGLSPRLQMPPTLLFSVFVGIDFKVKCYRKSSIVQVRHLINGFTSKLELYSQLSNVIDYVSSIDPSLHDELHSLEKRLTDLCNHEDVDEDLKYIG